MARQRNDPGLEVCPRGCPRNPQERLTNRSSYLEKSLKPVSSGKRNNSHLFPSMKSRGVRRLTHQEVYRAWRPKEKFTRSDAQDMSCCVLKATMQSSIVARAEHTLLINARNISLVVNRTLPHMWKHAVRRHLLNGELEIVCSNMEFVAIKNNHP